MFPGTVKACRIRLNTVISFAYTMHHSRHSRGSYQFKKVKLSLRGAATGPAAILTASHQVDLFDVEIGHRYQVGIAMLPESRELR
jgi:hypothetical protein